MQIEQVALLQTLWFIFGLVNTGVILSMGYNIYKDKEDETIKTVSDVFGFWFVMSNIGIFLGPIMTGGLLYDIYLAAEKR